VYIKAIHGGALGAGLKDKIFITDGATYTLTSTLANGLTSGTNVNPGYYVQNPTADKIFSDDFVWLSDTPQNYIDFGTTATTLNSAIRLELCAPTATGANLVTVVTVSPTTASVGDTVTYTVTVTNNGPENATNVQTYNDLSNSIENPTYTPIQGSYDNNIWSIGTLTNGASTTMTIVGTVGDGIQGGKIPDEVNTVQTQNDPTTVGDVLTAEVSVNAITPLPGNCTSGYNWDNSGWTDGDMTGTITLSNGMTADIAVSSSSAGSFSLYELASPYVDSINGSAHYFGGISDLGVLFNPDVNTTTSPVTVTLNFSEPVYNASFLISDIDASGALRDDKVTVTSDIGSPTVTVLAVTNPTVISNSSNSAESIADIGSDDDNQGTVRVTIPNGATTVTIVYEEINTLTDNNPVRGAGFFGNLAVCKANVEPAPEVLLIDAIDVNETTPTTVTTNDATPEINGTCEAGNTVTVQIDGTDITPTTVCTDAGTFSITPDTELEDGEHNVTATQTDPDTGVTSEPSAVDYLTVDTVTPSPLTIDNVDGQTGSPVTTTDTTPEINGTCETGLRVIVQIDGTDISPDVNCTDGTYSMTPDTPLSLGEHNVTSTQTDEAGNTATAGPIALTVEKPAAPEVLLIDTTDVNETTPTTVITNDATPEINGTCIAGDTVTIQIDGTDITPTRCRDI